LEKLKEYDKEGVEKFLELNQEKGLLNQYSLEEIKELLIKKEKLVKRGSRGNFPLAGISGRSPDAGLRF